MIFLYMVINTPNERIDVGFNFNATSSTPQSEGPSILMLQKMEPLPFWSQRNRRC